MDALRVEVSRHGVKVVLIEPGGLSTHIWQDMEAAMACRTGSRYESQYRRVRTLLRPHVAAMSRPEVVARVIGNALCVGSPRARYLVGRAAQGIAAIRALGPAEMRDRIARLFTGLEDLRLWPISAKRPSWS
jgi:NAD(P)-dependent dehydrogenase (short-subunit alcohol dehydrogenase family)